MDDANLDLLPMLVADLASDEARAYLEAVAAEGRTVFVPLVAPPVDTSRHVLEVYSPGSEQALVLIAEAAGAPTAEGFPLRLSLPASAARKDTSGAGPARRSEAPFVQPAASQSRSVWGSGHGLRWPRRSS